MSYINFNFVFNNVKGMESSKMHLKQFEDFKSKLKPSRLLFLQERHSSITCEKSERMNLELICTFLMVHLIPVEFSLLSKGLVLVLDAWIDDLDSLLLNIYNAITEKNRSLFLKN